MVEDTTFTVTLIYVDWNPLVSLMREIIDDSAVLNIIYPWPKMTSRRFSHSHHGMNYMSQSYRQVAKGLKEITP